MAFRRGGGGKRPSHFLSFSAKKGESWKRLGSIGLYERDNGPLFGGSTKGKYLSDLVDGLVSADEKGLPVSVAVFPSNDEDGGGRGRGGRRRDDEDEDEDDNPKRRKRRDEEDEDADEKPRRSRREPKDGDEEEEDEKPRGKAGKAGKKKDDWGFDD